MNFLGQKEDWCLGTKVYSKASKNGLPASEFRELVQKTLGKSHHRCKHNLFVSFGEERKRCKEQQVSREFMVFFPIINKKKLENLTKTFAAKLGWKMKLKIVKVEFSLEKNQYRITCELQFSSLHSVLLQRQSKFSFCFQIPIKSVHRIFWICNCRNKKSHQWRCKFNAHFWSFWNDELNYLI